MTVHLSPTTAGLQYAVDVVLCVDATASMGPILASVQRSALTFHELLLSAMAKKGKGISKLRLRLIAFRDFGDRADDAIQESRFFTLPDEISSYGSAVSAITAVGGGDLPESGLEALALAINSEWESGLDRRRHVIVVFTEAPAHPLGSPGQTSAPNYPQVVPASMDGLFHMWGHAQSRGSVMENAAKRLLLFAPDAQPWADISEEWNNTLYFPSTAGLGLEEWEMDGIIDTIANSL